MIATRSVERSRSALLHNSCQLHSRLLYPLASHHSSRLLTTINNNHNPPARRLFQTRHAHTSVPFGWTNLDENGEPLDAPGPNEFLEPPSRRKERVRLARRPTTPGSILGPGPLLPKEDPGRSGTVSYYHAALEALLAALRRGDTFELYLCLMSLVREHETETGSRAFTEVVASIPATTFSEILRNFDPHKVSEEIDTAPGVNISYGVAQYTPLGELVNKWGVKILYVRILRRLLHIQLARRNAGLVPLMNDYLVLMRCAGATSNIRVAKDIWYSMSHDRRSNIRHSEAYSDFIKARYLAEKIYANNDLSRFRLRPLDMHRSSLQVPGRARLRLQGLTGHITDRRKHRFGSNTHERFFDIPLTAVLRKRNPLLKLDRAASLRGFKFASEDLTCALMKVNARAGRMRAINSLLKSAWGIVFKRDKNTGAIAVEGGHTYPPDSPRAPTAALLDAIVHSYCCMGEVSLAVRLLDYVSQRFSIPVPDRVWSDLIEYTRVMGSKPAAKEWAIAGFPHKGVRADQMLEVWSLCTQAPYSFQPGARDYYNLIKSLVRKSQPMARPIAALRQIKPLYEGVVSACDRAWYELMQTTQQGVPNYDAYRRYRVLQARRSHMWFMFHYSTHLILKGTRPGRIDDFSAVREVPKMVGEFSHFLPRRVRYHVATGDVEISFEPVREKDVVDVEQTVQKPMKTRYKHLPAAGKGGREADLLREQEQRRDDHPEDMVNVGPPLAATGEGKDNISSKDEDKDNSSCEDETPRFEPSPEGLGHRVTRPWVLERREAEKPAYLYRPRYSGPADQQSMLSIRRDGGEFMGYYDDPLRRHFAAYQVSQTTRRVFGKPVEMEWFKYKEMQGNKKRRTKIVDELLRMRT